MRNVLTCRLVLLAFGLTGDLGDVRAHDPWVETNTTVVRVGDVIHADLKLGNHGNNHRDFKLAGRLNPEWSTLELVLPNGQREDIKDRLTATAYAEKEGYWTTTFVPQNEGLHVLVQTLDRVMNHGKAVRAVRTGKAFFMASKSLDKPSCDAQAAAKPLGLPIELILESCPISAVSAERPVKVQLLLHGKPLPNAVVSFIPRGVDLAEDFDTIYERKTDAAGKAAFTPKQGNLYLIVAKHTAEDEKSAEYEYTSYGTTLTLHVPLTCACCLE